MFGSRLMKVKTTAPKQYCVRPNSGRIEAGMEVEVQGKPWRSGDGEILSAEIQCSYKL